MLAWFARRTCDPDVALELVAETFAQAFVARTRFRGRTPGEAGAWLYGIARRQLALYFRRGEVAKRALSRLQIEVPSLSLEEHERLAHIAELDELRVVLREELSRLSTAQRHALFLRVIEERPYSEVATCLRISEQAARARVARGLKALSVALEGTHLKQEA